MQATLAPSSDATLTPKDRQLLANAPYAQASIPEQYRRHIVDYPHKERPGSILVDTDARYLYYVLPGGKAIRYGVAVGEEALAFSGVATVGRMAEWPDWIPTPEIQARLGPYPPRIAGGPANPLARGRCTSMRATRTPCIASTAPTSRNISARPYPPAASA
jgi:lipoprotein-anchoring transpeptidase ErfK/SrfK